MTPASPLQVPSRGRARPVMPEPTIANWPNMGRVFVAGPEVPAALCCPACALPFENDGDRYFRAGCLDCGWRRDVRGGRS